MTAEERRRRNALLAAQRMFDPRANPITAAVSSRDPRQAAAAVNEAMRRAGVPARPGGGAPPGLPPGPQGPSLQERLAQAGAAGLDPLAALGIPGTQGAKPSVREQNNQAFQALLQQLLPKGLTAPSQKQKPKEEKKDTGKKDKDQLFKEIESVLTSGPFRQEILDNKNKGLGENQKPFITTRQSLQAALSMAGKLGESRKDTAKHLAERQNIRPALADEFPSAQRTVESSDTYPFGSPIQTGKKGIEFLSDDQRSEEMNLLKQAGFLEFEAEDTSPTGKQVRLTNEQKANAQKQVDRLRNEFVNRQLKHIRKGKGLEEAKKKAVKEVNDKLGPSNELIAAYNVQAIQEKLLGQERSAQSAAEVDARFDEGPLGRMLGGVNNAYLGASAGIEAAFTGKPYKEARDYLEKHPEWAVLGAIPGLKGASAGGALRGAALASRSSKIASLAAKIPVTRREINPFPEMGTSQKTVKGDVAPDVKVPTSKSTFQKEVKKDAKRIADKVDVDAAARRKTGRSNVVGLDIAMERALGPEAAAGLRALESKHITLQQKAQAHKTTLRDSYLEKVFKKSGLEANKENASILSEFGSTKNSKALKSLPKPVQQSIIKADKAHRKFFDDLLKQINVARRARGEAPVGKLDDYYTSLDNTGKVRSFIRKLTGPDSGYVDTGTPTKTSPFFSKERKGKFRNTDALTAADRYFDAFSDDMYLGESAARYEALLKALKSKKGGEKLKNPLTALENRITQLRGSSSVKFNLPGLEGEASLPNRGAALDATEFLTSRTSAAQLGMSPSATLVQTINAAVAGAQHPVSFLKTLKSSKLTYGDSAKSQFLSAKYADTKDLSEGYWQKIVRGGYYPMKLVEERSSRLAWNTLYKNLRSKGVKESAAVKQADIEIKRLGSSRLKGDRPAVFQSKALSPFSKFTYEAANNLTYLRELRRQGRYKDLAGAMIGLEAYNKASEAVLGYSPVFSPIDQAEKTVENVKQGDAAQLVGEPLGAFLSQRPLGLLPASLVPEEKRKEFFGESQIGRFGVEPPVAALLSGFGDLKNPDWDRGAAELATKIGLPTAGQQALRTFKGAEAISKGEVKNRGDEKVFNVDDNPVNAARALILGPYGTAEGRKWSKELESARAKGMFLPSSDQKANLEKFLDNYDKLQKAGFSDAGKLNLTDEQKSVIAATIKGGKIGKGFGELGADFMKKAVDKAPDGEKENVRNALRLYVNAMNSIKDTAETKQQLDRDFRRKEIGLLEYEIKNERVKNDIVSENTYVKGYAPTDLAYFINQTSDDEKQALARRLYDSAQKGDKQAAKDYENLFAAWKSQLEQQAAGGDTSLNTPSELFIAQSDIPGTKIASKFPDSAVDLSRMQSKEDQAKVAQANPNLPIAQAIQYVQERVKAGDLSESSASSALRGLNKLLSGDYSAATGGGSGGGGRGGKKGVRKKGGRGGRVGGRPKKTARASRRPSVKRPSIAALKTTGGAQSALEELAKTLGTGKKKKKQDDAVKKLVKKLKKKKVIK